MSVEEIETRVLPDGWEWTTLGEIADTSSGGTPSRTMTAYFSGSIPWVKSGELNDGQINQVEESISEEAVNDSSAKIFPKGTLLIALYGATVGKLGVLGLDAATNQAVCGIFPSAGISTPFLFHLLFSMRSDLQGAAKGGAQSNISQQLVRQILVPLPPFNEQKRIVEKLEVLLSDLDAAVQSLTTALEKLKHYRRSVLKAAVEGELTQEWRAGNQATLEPASGLLARILQERRERWEAEQQAKGRKNAVYEESAAPDVSSLPELPEGWVWATLKSVTNIKGGITKDSKRIGTELRQVPYLRVANVQRGYLNLSEIKEINASENEIEDLKLRYEDILFNEGGDRDKLGRGWIWENQISECVFQNHVFRARLVLREIEPKLISWWGNTFGQEYFMQRGTQTTNLASINITKLGELPIPIAPSAEQKIILDIIESHLNNADELESNIKTQLAQAEQTRQSMLEQAFSGKLVPQDPNDEPATLLLERIREEKNRASQEAKVKKPKSTKAKTQQATQPTGLAETLRTAGKALTPEELFRAAGYTFETKEQFFQDVRTARAAGLIEEKRLSPSARDSLLSVPA